VSAAEASEVGVEWPVQEVERLQSTLGLLFLLLFWMCLLTLEVEVDNVFLWQQQADDFVAFPLLSGAWSS
jgi:hypothetical protein